MATLNFFYDSDSRAQLISKVSELLELKENGSLMELGGGNWQLGEAIATQSNSHYYYVDTVENSDVIQTADAADYTTETLEDITNAQLIAALGKYDGIIIKGVFERGIADLSDYFAHLYKTLKLNSNAIIIARTKPPVGFPLPQKAIEQFSTKLPSTDSIKKAAEESDFEFILSTPVQVTFTIQRDIAVRILKLKQLACLSDLSDAELENFVNEILQEKEENLQCQDEFIVIKLTKVIS